MLSYRYFLARRLYWADPVFDEIVSVDYWGNNREVVVQDPNAIINDVQLDSDYVYYIGWNRPYVDSNFTYLSPGVRKPIIWILTRSVTNQAEQLLEMARGWKFCI